MMTRTRRLVFLLATGYWLLSTPLLIVVALLTLLLRVDLAGARGGRGGGGRRRVVVARVDARGRRFRLLRGAGVGRGGGRQPLAGRGRQRHLFELGLDVERRRELVALRGGGDEG